MHKYITLSISMVVLGHTSLHSMQQDKLKEHVQQQKIQQEAQHKEIVNMFVASIEYVEPPKLTEQVQQEEIKSLDDDVSVQTYKLYLQNGNNIEISKPLLEHSVFLKTLLDDKEANEFLIPDTSGVTCARPPHNPDRNAVFLEDIQLILQTMQKIMSQPWCKKAHDITQKIDAIEKTDDSVDVIQQEMQTLFAMEGVEKAFEDDFKSLPLKLSDKISIYQIAKNFHLDTHALNALALEFNVLEGRMINYDSPKEKRTWQELKELKTILRFCGLKIVADAFNLKNITSKRWLRLYALGQYLDIQPFVEYIKPYVARVILNNYFDQGCSSIIKKFDPAWENALKTLICNDIKKAIEKKHDIMTPIYQLRHFNMPIVLNLITIAGRNYLYAYDERGYEYGWDLRNGCLELFGREYRINLYNRNWSNDNKNKYFVRHDKSVKNSVNIYEIDWNLTLEQMSFIKEILQQGNIERMRTQHPEVYASLPETWKRALEPEKAQFIPGKKWKAYLYSFPPFMRKAFYGAVGALGITTAWMLWKFKKQA